MTDLQTPSRRAIIRGLGFAAAGAAAATGATSAAAQGADPRPLVGKIAIVTGARNNLGRGFAQRLAQMGADVVVHHHRPESRAEAEETADLVRAAGARAAVAHGDLGDSTQVAALFDVAETEFGGTDILVHCAGTIIKKPVAEFTDAEFERLVNDNTMTTFYAMREAARRLRDGGRIIAVGTSLTAGAAPGYAGYGGTKAPVEEFTRMLAKELGDRRITVNNVAPGPIDTPFFHAAETPQSVAYASGLSTEGRLGTVADVVPAVANLVLPESQWTNGQTVFVNGGYLTR
ncbi:SDR family oxidoreductase [Jannaschia aquimarina]|uniref:FabL protein n=1 Tax=Jannaschia aquimarina TaxID=935700 RepID=A0A0D1EH53_9RHOB|nr:SDR family oxidoreductase [Jannaschia aquimarina]KIT16211.1 Enoyl-[acyl-carrier-protein] reductase [NADPH] FabL [Jannaschia aquimarina]SNT17388.1 NAD(P)-dependent dehydrogenase, short-chain alcohol dehydrogenase family [Jannaschia aquimarina]